jgi:hypothetical protein
MTRNHAAEGGGAIFFVSNDRSGVLDIRSSTLRDNPSDGFETVPGIFFLGRAMIAPLTDAGQGDRSGSPAAQ